MNKSMFYNTCKHNTSKKHELLQNIAPSATPNSGNRKQEYVKRRKKQIWPRPNGLR